MSLHSSPLAELGGEIEGGMNVFLREVTHEFHKLGMELDIFTRRDDPNQPRITNLSDGVRLILLKAGPPTSCSREQLTSYIPEMINSLKSDQYLFLLLLLPLHCPLFLLLFLLLLPTHPTTPPSVPIPLSRVLARSAPKSPSGEKITRASRSEEMLHNYPKLAKPSG